MTTNPRIHLRRVPRALAIVGVLAASAVPLGARTTAAATELATRVTLTTTHNPAYSAQGGAITATVRPVTRSAVIPTGVVDLVDADGTVVWSASLDATGRAKVAYADLGAGTWTFAAVYGGDATYATSTSAVLAQEIRPTAPSTTVTATPATVAVGSPSRVVVAATNATPIGIPSAGIGVLLPPGAHIVSSPSGVGCRRAWPNLYYCLVSLPRGATKRIVLDVVPIAPGTVIVSGYASNAATGESTSAVATVTGA